MSVGADEDWTVVRGGKGSKKGKGGISLSKASRLAEKARASSLADCDCNDSPEEIQKRHVDFGSWCRRHTRLYCRSAFSCPLPSQT